jgi:hypothetical protein
VAWTTGSSIPSGGGIRNAGSAVLINVTMSGNTATQGGGFNTSTQGWLIFSTIIANSTGGNCYEAAGGTIASNLSDDGTCGFGGAGHDNVTNINLGPLANNGGPTLTFMLASNSAAVNAGYNPTCPATD